MSDPYCNEGQKRFNSLTFLQSIYNDPSEAKSLRMRAAIEALLFEFPKLAVTAQLNSETCAAQWNVRREDQRKPSNSPRPSNRSFTKGRNVERLQR
jgi:hypothetical protein